MFCRLSFLCILLLLVSVCSGAVFAADDVPFGSIYHDAKFNFKIDVGASKKDYKATVTRKNDDFNAYHVLFIYNLIVKEGNSIYPTTITDYLSLDPGMKSNSVNRRLSASQTLVQIKEQSYGIKFAPFSEISGVTSLSDTVFGLCLKYCDKQLKWEDPSIKYFFYRRMVCHLIVQSSCDDPL